MGRGNEDFHNDYIHEFGWIPQFIERSEAVDLLKYDRYDVDVAMRELAKMEKDFHKLLGKK